MEGMNTPFPAVSLYLSPPPFSGTIMKKQEREIVCIILQEKHMSFKQILIMIFSPLPNVEGGDIIRPTPLNQSPAHRTPYKVREENGGEAEESMVTFSRGARAATV